MAQEGGPPPGAMRAGWKGSVVAVLAIVVAVIAFLAGFFAGGVFLAPGPPAQLVVGSNTPFPPFEFRDSEGNIIGFDIDLITEVLRRMGFVNTQTATEWVLFDFRDFSGGLLPAVQAGRVDIGLGPTTITEARKATLDFSDPFFESDQGVLVRAQDTRNWCVDDNNCQGSDIDAAGGASYKVAVQTGTTSDCWVTEECWGEANLANAAVERFASVEGVLTALETNAVDLVVVDRPAADGIAAAQPLKFAVGGTIQTDELYGFATAKGDRLQLIPRINQALAAMKADGKYDEICVVWFQGPCP